MKDDTTATTRRRAIFLALSAVFLLPAPASAQQECPKGGYHLWVVWGVDRRTRRVIQRCMKCGTFKIG